MARAGRWAVVTAAFVAAQAPSAWATVAAPNGRPDAPCTESDPCDVRSALRAAGPGGEVALRSGTYDLRGAPQVVVGSSIWMHGPIGGPRPVLVGDAPGGVVRVADRAAVLEHVAVEPIANARRGIEATSGVARDVVVHVTGTGAAACELVNGMVVSSVCWSSGGGGSGVVVDAAGNDAAGVIVSSTIAGQVAVRASSSAGHSGTVAVDSSILLGGPGGRDILTSGAGAQRVITSYSSFDDASGPGLQSLGGDQGGHPLLADPANGDFRQLAGSPTIDAGSPVDNIDHGRFDLDGEERVLGGRLDIGADEFSPPRIDGPAPGGGAGDQGGAAAGGNEQRRPSGPRRPARLTRLRVVARQAAAGARRSRGRNALAPGARRRPAPNALAPGAVRRGRGITALFRLDRSSPVRLTLTRIGRRFDRKTSVVVRGMRGLNQVLFSGRLRRAARHRASYLLQARPNGGRPQAVRFRLGRAPYRFSSAD